MLRQPIDADPHRQIGAADACRGRAASRAARSLGRPVRRRWPLWVRRLCAVAVALCGLAAYLFKQPMLFPSLEPSALLFFEQPTAPESSPYNALVALALLPLGASHPPAE